MKQLRTLHSAFWVLGACISSLPPASASPNWIPARRDIGYGLGVDVDKNSIRQIAEITTFQARWVRYGIPQSEMGGAALCGTKPPKANDGGNWYSIYEYSTNPNGDAGTLGAEKVCNIVNSR